jgi:4a-hydroxytetrahydrobiopterin dehydratase
MNNAKKDTVKPLYQRRCVPCEGNIPAFARPKNLEYLKRVNEWQLIDDISIEKIYLFKDFKETIIFVNKVADIAEAENHHPDILIFGWNKLKISLSTHAIGGLSENDFILASKIDNIRL